MERRIAYVESIDWAENECTVRVPNLDGFNDSAYSDADIAVLLQGRCLDTQLEHADIPYHLQGLRVKDVIYVLDSEDSNDHLVIVGFFGGTYG